MKVSEFYEKTLHERIINDCEISDVKVHADEKNEVRCIEVKYAMKGMPQDGDIKIPIPHF